MSSAKTKLIEHFFANFGLPIKKDDLASIAGVHDWARVIRMLRQEGWSIELLPDGCYKLNSKKKAEGKQRGIMNQKLRYKILHRDRSTCNRCGRTRDDGVKLMVDHKIPVEWDGETTEDNLWALCEECNLGKKHWFKDSDPEIMKKIFNLKSGYQRLKEYFEVYPNTLLEVVSLDLISGIRDWERTLRLIRKKEKMNIKHIRRDPETDKEGYIYIKS